MVKMIDTFRYDTRNEDFLFSIILSLKNLCKFVKSVVKKSA